MSLEAFTSHSNSHAGRPKGGEGNLEMKSTVLSLQQGFPSILSLQPPVNWKLTPSTVLSAVFYLFIRHWGAVREAMMRAMWQNSPQK